MHGHLMACGFRKTGNASDCKCKAEGIHYLRLASYSLGLFLFELLCGLTTNSAALVSDSIHVLFDGSESILSFVVSVIARRIGHEATIRRWAGYLSGALLVIAALGITNEGVMRLLSPEKVSPWVVLCAGVSLVVTMRQIVLHRNAPDEHKNITHWWQDKHLYSDAWALCGIIGGGLITIFTGWLIIDPLLSIAIGLRILWMIYGRFTGVHDHTHGHEGCGHHHH